MLLPIPAYVGGVLTILSPCILPVLPFVLAGQRLYQLVRQPPGGAERTFEIIFQDSGVRAYAFTFG